MVLLSQPIRKLPEEAAPPSFKEKKKTISFSSKSLTACKDGWPSYLMIHLVLTGSLVLEHDWQPTPARDWLCGCLKTITQLHLPTAPLVQKSITSTSWQQSYLDHFYSNSYFYLFNPPPPFLQVSLPLFNKDWKLLSANKQCHYLLCHRGAQSLSQRPPTHQVNAKHFNNCIDSFLLECTLVWKCSEKLRRCSGTKKNQLPAVVVTQLVPCCLYILFQPNSLQSLAQFLQRVSHL